MNERGESENRWQHRFEWLNPEGLPGDSGDLHWQKISSEAARQSFEALGRLQSDMDMAALADGHGWQNERERLAALRGVDGEPRYSATDLKWFETYFGSSRIKVDALEDGFDVINGRHRLAAAQRYGAAALPVFVARKSEETNGRGVIFMGNELREYEEAAEQQEGRANELQEEVEAHRERVDKLNEATKELQAVMERLNSDEARQALDAVQRTKEETERSLEEKRQEQENLLAENEQMGRENAEAYREAQQALEKVQDIARIAGGDEGNIAGYLSETQKSLADDVSHRAQVDAQLMQAKQKLQLIF